MGDQSLYPRFIEPLAELPTFENIAARAGEYERAESYISQNDVWLQSLCDRPITDEWIEETNLLIALGSQDLSRVRDGAKIEAVQTARERFFEVMLGVGHEEHPLYAAYHRFSKSRPILISTDRFIHTMRIVAGTGADAQKALKNYFDIVLVTPELLTLKLESFSANKLDKAKMLESAGIATRLERETFQSRVDNIAAKGLCVPKVVQNYGRIVNVPEAVLDDRFGALVDEVGDSAINIANAFPSVLGNDTKRIAHRIRTLERVIVATGWNMNVIDLISAAPSLLSTSTEKLFAHIGLVRKFKYDMTVNRLSKLVREPLESHIVAVTLLDGAPYTLGSVQRSIKQVPKDERVTKAEALVQHPHFAQVIGITAYRNYKKYADKQKAKRAA